MNPWVKFICWLLNLNTSNFKPYKLLSKTVPFKITARNNLSVSDYLLLLDLKELQRYPYTYEETEAQKVEGIVQSSKCFNP